VGFTNRQTNDGGENSSTYSLKKWRLISSKYVHGQTREGGCSVSADDVMLADIIYHLRLTQRQEAVVPFYSTSPRDPASRGSDGVLLDNASVRPSVSRHVCRYSVDTDHRPTTVAGRRLSADSDRLARQRLPICRSVILRQRCDKLCTSGFVDDLVVTYRICGASLAYASNSTTVPRRPMVTAEHQ